MTLGKNETILPWFTLENYEPLRPWISLQEMHATLVRGGFIVSSIFDIDGQHLNFVLSSPPVNHVRFQVSLPEGWSLVAGYDGYGLPEPDLLVLLDSRGHLRGHVCLEEVGDMRVPQETKLYCRYTILRLPSFCRLPIELPKDHLTDVVVDRIAVDYRQPADFPVVPFHHSRPARKFEGPISLSEADLESMRKSMEEDAARVREGRPKPDPPVYAWLHENHPDWRNPFAYW